MITGRCVDSAVTLGPLIHHFGWTMDQFDRLAGGSLAGHIIECGCQATGGLFTDWDQVPDWAHIGYPIVEVADDGSFSVGKAPGTGGLVSPATVGEQLLYEIGDPGAYLLPDVACDFRQVTMEQVGPDRVRVSGAKGSAPPATLKVSATTLVGWRVDGMTVIVGIDAVAKARRTGESLIERTREMILARGWDDFSATRVEVIGTETPSYGPRATARLREVIVRVRGAPPGEGAGAVHPRNRAPGIAGARHHRPRRPPQGVAGVPLFSFLCQVRLDVTLDVAASALRCACPRRPRRGRRARAALRVRRVARRRRGVAAVGDRGRPQRRQGRRREHRGDRAPAEVAALIGEQITAAAVPGGSRTSPRARSRATTCQASTRTTSRSRTRSAAAAPRRCATTRWARHSAWCCSRIRCRCRRRGWRRRIRGLPGRWRAERSGRDAGTLADVAVCAQEGAALDRADRRARHRIEDVAPVGEQHPLVSPLSWISVTVIRPASSNGTSPSS